MNYVDSYNAVIKVFEDSLNDLFIAPYKKSTASYEIRSEDDSTIIEIELPGVPKDSVKVLLEDKRLTVKFKKKSVEQEMSFKLAYDFKQEHVHVKLVDGLLTCTLVKSPQAEKKTLEIPIGS